MLLPHCICRTCYTCCALHPFKLPVAVNSLARNLCLEAIGGFEGRSYDGAVSLLSPPPPDTHATNPSTLPVSSLTSVLSRFVIAPAAP
jgi:hypothetical protein